MNTEKIIIMDAMSEIDAIVAENTKERGMNIVDDESKTLMLPYIATELFRGEALYDLPRISHKTLKQSTTNQRKRRKLGRQNPHSKYAK